MGSLPEGWDPCPSSDITKLHRLKRDLETDSSKMTTLRGFFLIWPSAVMSRGVQERIKSLVRYRRRKCRNIKKFLELEFFDKCYH